jgi:hypothetical protein
MVHDEARPRSRIETAGPKRALVSVHARRGSNGNLEMDICLCHELGQLDSDWRHIDPPYICLLQVHQMGSH